MNNQLNEIKDRVRKLLAVAADGSGATQGEIENAIAFAASLMEKHHLSADALAERTLDEIKADAANAKKGRFYATIGGKSYAWEAALASFVSDFTGVERYLNSEKRTARYPDGRLYINVNNAPHEGKSYVFYGIAEEAAFAVILFYELWNTIRLAGLAKFGKVYVGDGGMYCEGFVRGLSTANEQRKEQQRLEAASSSTALMVLDDRRSLIDYKQDVSRDWLKAECGVNLVRGSSRSGATGSHEAYREGMSDGSRQKVSRHITPKLT